MHRALLNILGTKSAAADLFDPSELEITAETGARAKSAKTAILVTQLTAPYIALDAFSETVRPANQGRFMYQLSNNNSAWYFHNGQNRFPPGPTPAQANSAADLTGRIHTFHLEVGMGSLSVKTFFISPSETERAQLKSIIAQGILPTQDAAD